MSGFRRAERSAVKIKMLVDGPSGSGKTFGALSIAEGLSETGKIALIDSEHDRSSFYADHFTFDKVSLESHHCDEYLKWLEVAVADGYDVIIVDSLSHCWLDLLERKEDYERNNPRANKWTLWGQFIPAWTRLLEAVLRAPVHVICTARSKQSYEQQDNAGKKEIVKLGLQPQVREGTEYEFGLVFSLETTHKAVATKDNTSLFRGTRENKLFDLADGSIPNALREWLKTAKAVDVPTPQTASAINALISKMPEALEPKFRKRWAERRLAGCTEAEAQEILAKVVEALEKVAPVQLTTAQRAPEPQPEQAPAPEAARAPEPEPQPAPTLEPTPLGKAIEEALPPAIAEAAREEQKQLASAAAAAAAARSAASKRAAEREERVREERAAASEDKPQCPKCGGAMFDNRKSKRNPKAPDFRCQDKKCDAVLWPGQWPPKQEEAELPLEPLPQPAEEQGGGDNLPVDGEGDDDLPF